MRSMRTGWANDLGSIPSLTPKYAEQLSQFSRLVNLLVRARLELPLELDYKTHTVRGQVPITPLLFEYSWKKTQYPNDTAPGSGPTVGEGPIPSWLGTDDLATIEIEETFTQGAECRFYTVGGVIRADDIDNQVMYRYTSGGTYTLTPRSEVELEARQRRGRERESVHHGSVAEIVRKGGWELFQPEE